MTRSLQDIIDANPEAETFRFGDGPKACAAVLRLVRAGKKTVTCEAMRVYAEGGDALPQPGRRDVALNWDGTPAVMVETIAVDLMRFDEMPEDRIPAMAEFRDLADWRAHYRAYFEATGGWSPEMKIMCETFRMVEDYADGDG